jgi:hypothetical protein
MTPEELSAILLILASLVLLLPLFATWVLAVALGNYTSVRSRLKRASLPHDFRTIAKEYMPKVHRWFALKFLIAGTLFLADSILLYTGNQLLIASAILVAGLLVLITGLRAARIR